MNHKTLIEIVRSKFPKAIYFNDKRKDHRRIKFYGAYGKQDLPKEIFNYLKDNYPELNVEITEGRKTLHGPKLFYSGCIVKCNLI